MTRHRIFFINYLVLAAFGLSILVPGCSKQQAADYKKLKYPKLGDIVAPEVKQLTLANGMKLFLLEDHELPLINVSAIIRTGSIYEPAEKIGLASITGEVMRTGGTAARTGDELDEELERLAASVETSIGLNSGSASVSVLKEDIDKGLAILADVLMNPEFREDKILLSKMQAKSMIARRNDNIRAIAGREFDKLIYGPQSVYARHEEYATIDSITRDDLIAFHKRFFAPNNMMLAACGDFNTDEMIRKIENAFHDWHKADLSIPKKPKVDYKFRKTVNQIRKDDVNQSNVYLGHIGGLMSDPDYFALVVMNKILGGGFTGRLFKNVRSREGLAYSVFGSYSANYDYPGEFYVGCMTKSGSTVYAIRAMLREVEKMREAEVTDEELALAKESFLNSFVFNFDTKGEIVRRLMIYEYFGYPADFLMKTKENVEKVNKADVLRVAKKHLKPDTVQILVVGRPDDFDQPLSTLGEVHEIDITIPPPAK
ncbi:MAG: insulinase family protein [Sedimentisphaerales bacterium]|nr:insulinase family protein [Sedimentisphaerales bacterium]